MRQKKKRVVLQKENIVYAESTNRFEMYSKPSTPKHRATRKFEPLRTRSLNIRARAL